MSELDLAIKGLWYHFKKCAAGIIWTTLDGVLKPVTKRTLKNSTTK